MCFVVPTTKSPYSYFWQELKFAFSMWANLTIRNLFIACFDSKMLLMLVWRRYCRNRHHKCAETQIEYFFFLLATTKFLWWTSWKMCYYWFNAKNRHLSQRKRKLYKKRESKKAKRPHFNISDISESESSTDSSASEDEIIH